VPLVRPHASVAADPGGGLGLAGYLSILITGRPYGVYRDWLWRLSGAENGDTGRRVLPIRPHSGRFSYRSTGRTRHRGGDVLADRGWPRSARSSSLPFREALTEQCSICSGGCTDLRRERQSTRSTERLSESSGSAMPCLRGLMRTSLTVLAQYDFPSFCGEAGRRRKGYLRQYRPLVAPLGAILRPTSRH
jgi:hypothetical protein